MLAKDSPLRSTYPPYNGSGVKFEKYGKHLLFWVFFSLQVQYGNVVYSCLLFLVHNLSPPVLHN